MTKAQFYSKALAPISIAIASTMWYGVFKAANAAELGPVHYQNVEVSRFAVQPGVVFPDDYAVAMMEDIVSQLQKSNKFAQVLRQGETPAEANSPTLQILGTVTDFKPGNRAMRYFVSFGAGKTEVKAHIKFVDAATGAVRGEKDVKGLVWIGFMGGESTGATHGIAKQIAKAARAEL